MRVLWISCLGHDVEEYSVLKGKYDENELIVPGIGVDDCWLR